MSWICHSVLFQQLLSLRDPSGLGLALTIWSSVALNPTLGLQVLRRSNVPGVVGLLACLGRDHKFKELVLNV